jgi:hypothetical protein
MQQRHVCKRSTDNSYRRSRFLADTSRFDFEIIGALGTSPSAHASFYRKQQSYQSDKSPKSYTKLDDAILEAGIEHFRAQIRLDPDLNVQTR